MHDSRGDEERVTRPERLALAAVQERSGTADDDIELIAAVRLLRVAAARRVQLQLERAVAEQRDETLAAGSGEPPEAFRDGDAGPGHPR